MVQVQYEYEEVVPSVAGGGFGIDTSGPNTSAPYEMVRDALHHATPPVRESQTVMMAQEPGRV